MTSAAADFAPQRRDRLSRIIRTRHAVRVDELRAELGVSPATIRRDLDELATAGELRRVHGGAVAIDRGVIEPVFDAKAGEAGAEKRRIAKAALPLIQPGDTVYLDSGSTVLELARLLEGRTDLTIVTNSLPVVVELVGRGPRVIVLGGELRPLSRAMVGPLTRHLLAELYVDRAFVGTLGLSLDVGLTTTDPSEAFTKDLVLERAREVILLADSRKLGTRSFAHAGRLEQIHLLVTDDAADHRTVRALERRGIRVVVV
jgi:DeoR family fructose operon transcriptional repressor